MPTSPVVIYRGVLSKTIIAFVRTHPNLGVPVSHIQDFSICSGQLPISRPYQFLQGHLCREKLDLFGLVFDSFA